MPVLIRCAVPAMLVALVALLAPGDAAAARRQAPTPCDPGRFVVGSTGPPAAHLAMSGIVVEPRNRLVVPGLCGATRARTKSSRRATRWTARWRKGCAGVGKGPATLRATVTAPGCHRMEGILVA